MSRVRRLFQPPSPPAEFIPVDVDARLKRELDQREMEIQNRLRAMSAEVALIMREEWPKRVS